MGKNRYLTINRSEAFVIQESVLLRFGAACSCALILASLGCSKGPPVVHGTVTLDGKPIEDGTIQFSALDGQAPTAGGQIVDGKFETRAAITKYRVKIESNVVLGPDGKVVDTSKKIDKYSNRANFTVKKLVPDKYNTQSELELDVKAGLNEPVFDLKSK
jgi:hypothetical protein